MIAPWLVRRQRQQFRWRPSHFMSIPQRPDCAATRAFVAHFVGFLHHTATIRRKILQLRTFGDVATLKVALCGPVAYTERAKWEATT